MEIAMIVFCVILLNTFLLNVIYTFIHKDPDSVFEVCLIWVFSVPIFVFIFIASCGKLFGKLIRALENFASK